MEIADEFLVVILIVLPSHAPHPPLQVIDGNS